MATTIKLKNGSGAPTTGDLVQGEPAFDLTNKRLYTEDSGGTVIEVGTNPTSLTTTTVSATGSVTGQKLVASDGLLELDDNGTHNGIINVPASLFINIDSDNTNTGEDFVIAKDRTSASGGTELFRVQEDGKVGIGTASPSSTAGWGTLLEVSGTANAGIKLTETDTANGDYSLGVTAGTLRVWDETTSSWRMTIDGSGNVGIGTTSPSTSLDVVRAGAMPLRVQSTSGTECQINMVNTGGNVQLEAHSGNFNIDADAVGIGTTSPDGKLNVFSASAGSVSADADADELVLENSGNVGLSLLTASTGESGIYFGNPGTNGQKDFYLKYYHESHATTANRRAFTFNTASTERMRIDSSGQVGIGTTSPNYPLHLNKSDSAGCWAQFTNSTTGTGAAAGALVGIDSNEDFRILQYEAKALALYTSATERMRISSSGFVGIGTSSPDRYLHVNQSRSGDWLAEIHNTHATNGYGLKVRAGDDANVSAMRVTDVSNNTLMEIQGGGNVGIGTTSPNGKLDITGSGNTDIYLNTGNNSGDNNRVFFGDTADIDVGYLSYDHGTNAMSFGVNASERMRIDSSGNLLIGQTVAAGNSNGIYLRVGQASGFTATNDNALDLFRKSSDGKIIRFYRDGTEGGWINVTSTSATLVNSSDERLKENIVDAPAGNIDAIRVRSFDWKVDGSHQTYGMVAQELVEVAPEAVSQGETEEDMWGVDYSRLVPMMIKEIQDLKAEVAALKGA